MGQISEMKRILTSRKYIREFAEDYAERYGKNAKDVEGDIIQAKKLNHISFGEEDSGPGIMNGIRSRKRRCPHFGPVWSSGKSLRTDAISVC